MKNGSILFLNELNRMPEGTQNVLLAAMDEGVIFIPKLGKVEANEGFLIISAMNPQEFVAIVLSSKKTNSAPETKSQS